MAEITREEALAKFTTTKGKTYKSTRVGFKSSAADAIAGFNQQLQAKAIVSAAAAGAKVLYDEMLVRVPVDESASRKGKFTLKESIYRYLDRDGSRDGFVQYAIGPNKSKAPHWFNVEYGHFRINVVVPDGKGGFIPTKKRLLAPKWVPASPYMRPTIDGKGAAAVQAAKDRLVQRLAELTS